MIPETKQFLVDKALRKVFGSTHYESIELLTRGLSTALVFKIIVRSNPYLLKLITRTDAMTEPTHQFACTRLAAEAGIAPQIHYMEIEDRISITDFIAPRPFPEPDAKETMANLLSRLHALPRFPFRTHYLERLADFVQKFQSAKIVPEKLTEEIFHFYARIMNTYQFRDEDMVSCHNDLKPENIIFDGTRPWLVDWEAAFLNDRYVDLSVVANFILHDEAEESAFLERYFGAPANEFDKARFFLMRQLVNIFYFVIFLLIGSGGKAIDPSMYKSEFNEFHRRMWEGEIDLTGNEAKLQYGFVHMQHLRKNLRSKRFEEALRAIET